MKLWDAIRAVSDDPAFVVGLVHVDQVARKVKLRFSIVDQPTGKEIILVGQPELNLSGNQSVAVALDTSNIEVDLDKLRAGLAAQPEPSRLTPEEDRQMTLDQRAEAEQDRLE